MSKLRSTGPGLKIKVAAGETIHVVVGGKGRPVVAKIGPVPAELEGAIASATLGTVFTLPEWAPPVEVMELPAAEAQAWRAKFENSEEGKQFRAAQHAALTGRQYFNGPVQPDGTIRIDEVEAGTYLLTVRWREARSRSQNRDQIAQANREVTVTEAPGGGASEEVVDAGELTPILQRKLAVGEALPDLELTMLDGKAAQLKDYRGKVLLIVPWNTYSREYLPPKEVQEVWAAHKDDGHFAILGVTSDAAGARKYAQARNITWQTATARDGYVVGQWFPFEKTVQCGLVSADGKILSAGLKPEEIKAAVENALKK